MIAQVDEQQVAMVALAMHPAGDTDGLPHMVGTQFVVLVGAVLVALALGHGILNRGDLSAFLKPLALGPHPPRELRTLGSRYALASG